MLCEGDGRLQTDSVFASVSPLNLNLTRLLMGGTSRAWDWVLHLNQDVMFLQRGLFTEIKFDVSIPHFTHTPGCTLITQLLLFVPKSC